MSINAKMNVRLIITGMCGVTVLLLALTTSTGQIRGSVKTDRNIYAEPPAPRLPRAGGKFFDPVFGTEIMRVTDESTAQDGGTYYSYWPTFNCDNTRLLVKAANDGSAYIYEFDPAAFTLGRRAEIPKGPSGYLGVEGAIWSGKDPDTLYGIIGLGIYAYHPSKQKFIRIADFSNKFPAGDLLWQLSMSSQDEVFAFSRRRPNEQGGSDYVGYTVYRRSDDSVILEQPIVKGDLDEVQIDKSGRWLTVKGETKTTKGFSIRDLQNKAIRSELGAGPPDYALGHSDNGKGFASGFNNYLNTLDRRDFTNPRVIVKELSLGQDWSQGLHISLLADDDSWMLISLYVVDPSKTPPGPFHNEIILVKTDGTETFRRLLHHHSVYKEYWDTPRANISRDGRFIAFTSNWGSTSHRDLFLARMPWPARQPSETRPRRIGLQ